MRILSEFRERLRALFFRSEEEQDLDEELRFHVEMEVEANIRRGLDPVEARRQALITFGGVERFKEEVREARGLAALEALVRDVRFALRRLVRESGFTVPVVLTLALGIGVTAAVFALVDGVLLRPLPYPAAERLVTVGHAATGMELPMAGLSPGIFQHYREQNHAFEEIAAYMEGTGTFTDLDRPEEVRRAYVSPELFTVLRAVPYLGRLPSTADVEPGFVGRELVISYDLWVRRYGADPGIVGRAVEWERRPREIVGVMPPGFHFPHPESQVWFAWPQAGSRASLRYLALSGVARLKPGVSPETARRELDRLVGTLPAAFPDITAAQLEDMGLHSVVRPLKDTIVGDTRVALLLLMATAGFLLLIT